MNCPYCNRKINAFTGLQELTKFNTHLRTCKKHPNRVSHVDEDGRISTVNIQTKSALTLRAESGQ